MPYGVISDYQNRFLNEHIAKSCKNGCAKVDEKKHPICDCVYRFRAARQLLMFGNFPINHLTVEADKAFEFVNDEDKKHIEEQKTKIDDFVGQGSSFYFYGTNGTGKTTSAVKFVEEIAYYYSLPKSYKHDKSYWYTSGAALFDSYYDGKGKEMYEKCKEVTVLVIDDFGKESFSVDSSENAKKQYNQIYESLLRARSDSNLPTIITSNVSLNEVVDKLSDGIKSLFGIKMKLHCVHQKCRIVKENCPLVIHKTLEEISSCVDKDHQCMKCINKINLDPFGNGLYRFIAFREDKGDVRADYESKKWIKKVGQ